MPTTDQLIEQFKAGQITAEELIHGIVVNNQRAYDREQAVREYKIRRAIERARDALGRINRYR